MSLNLKFLAILLSLMVLPFQKQKDECLIIYLKDNKELYRVGTVGNYKDQFYIYLKYKNVPKDDTENPLATVPYIKNPKGTSYNLSNKRRIDNLPDDVNNCKCSGIEYFNLGMKFRLYIEKEKGWTVYDAEKLLVKE